MSQPEPPSGFLSFLRAMFGTNAIFVVEHVDPRSFELCDNPSCVGCVEERKRRMAEYNRRVARSSQN